MTTQPTDCFICRKHRGEIVLPGGAIYEDDQCYIGHILDAQKPEKAYLGYLMVEPKRHVAGLAELTDAEAQAIGLQVTRASQALKACTDAVHIYAFVLGDHVSHVHIHVVPRYPGAPRDYWGTHVTDWPEAPRGDAKAIEQLCERLRTYLATE